MKKTLKTKVALAMSLIPFFGFAQVDSAATKVVDSTTHSKIFKLGEVTVGADKRDELIHRISSETMDAQNKMEVSKALNMMAGITLTASGPRNESMVNIRGFDLRQIPVYMDGIPVYVPYDGYVDLGRFTTFDLAAIDVSKGFASMLYGPNSLGAAINLLSRKPTKQFEVDGALGSINTNGYRGNINVGSNLGKFYLQGGYSYLHRDAFRMSEKFEPTKNENGKERDNSYRTDQKANFKLGWTPKEGQEYAISYINQQGKKGTPVYCGNDPLNSMIKSARYWQWPIWNKETVAFLSNTALNEKNNVKVRVFYDIFKNSIFSYDDDTYTTQKKPYAFQSWYNDYTYGSSVEFGTQLIPKNNLKFAVHYKADVHREHNLEEPVRHFQDNTITVAAEDIFKLTDKFIVIAGLSYNARKNDQAEDYNSSTKTVSDFLKAPTSSAFNGQVGFFYYLKSNHKVGITASQKTRFATIKDRYSYRMGTAIPNPDLKPETATNYELNYTGTFYAKWTFQGALFYNHLTDAILNVANIQPGKSQMQNIGKAEFMGVEATLKYTPIKTLSLGTNYSYIERHNLTSPTVLFTDVPNTKVIGFAQYQPIKRIQIMANTEYNSSRFSTSYGTHCDAFTLINASVSGQIWKYMSLEAGVNNIFDTNYSLVEGYPEEGRNFFITLRFFNHK